MASSIPNRGPELLAIDAVFMSLAIVANSLRCYVRISMVKAFGLDDWLMSSATICFIGYSVSSMLGTHYGTGRHRDDLSVEGYATARHCWWFCYLFYAAATILAKLSIGCFLLRIAVRKLHTYIIYAAMLFSVVAGGTFFFVSLFQCNPIHFFWNKEQNGTCVKDEVIIGLAYLYSTFAVLTDFTFALLPAFLVVGLQLKRRTKLALIPLLAMGCIASLAVVARMPLLPRLSSQDFLWDTLDVAIWSTVEQGLAITAGSLATLRPLFKIILCRLGLTTRATSARGKSGSGMLGSTSRRRPSRPELDVYNLTVVAEDGQSKPHLNTHVDAAPEVAKSQTWYQGPLDKVRRKSAYASHKKSGTTTTDDGSEKSLRNCDSASIREDHSMQIMVSRSFFVTDAERNSYIEKAPQ